MKSYSPTGLFYIVLSYVWWGMTPLFWKSLEHVAPLEILAHRILWSFAFLAPIFLKPSFRSRVAGTLRSAAQWRYLLLATVAIGLNWGSFIIAMVSERILEASLGYFIAPMVFVIAGVWWLGERLNTNQKLSVALAAAGIALLVARVGSLPWIALTLAITFTVYGYCKKKSALDASSSVALETLLLGIPAIGYVATLGASHDALTWGLLIASGPVTLLPQVWFTLGSRSIGMATAGFLQYLAPTINFAIGLFVFHEHFDPARAMTFSLIWMGLALYCMDLWRRHRAAERRRTEPAPLASPAAR